MKNNLVKVGVIGAGGAIGSIHATTIATHIEGATLAAVYDINTESINNFAVRFGATIMPSAEALINSSEVDAVIIASWDSTHADLTLKCIQINKPVFFENR